MFIAMDGKVFRYLGGLEIVVGGVMSAFPQLIPQEIGLAIVAFGVITILFSIRKDFPHFADKVSGLFGLRPTSPWPDFKHWDSVERFELHQAASLWCDRTPSLPMHSQAKRIYDRFVQHVKDEKLRLYYASIREAVEAAVEKHMPEWADESTITVHSAVYRDELKRYARELGQRPKFLFRDARGV